MLAGLSVDFYVGNVVLVVAVWVVCDFDRDGLLCRCRSGIAEVRSLFLVVPSLFSFLLLEFEVLLNQFVSRSLGRYSSPFSLWGVFTVVTLETVWT